MLELVPISLKEANAFVEKHHRHHKQVTGHKFSVAAAVNGEIVGVAGVRRPEVDLYPAQLKLRFEISETAE